MPEALITYVSTVTDITTEADIESPTVTYPVTQVYRIEFDDEQGFRNLLEVLRSGSTPAWSAWSDHPGGPFHIVEGPNQLKA